VIPAPFDGLLVLILCLGPYLIIQRALQFELHAVFLLLTRRHNIAHGIYAILFFPGVLLHELSHFLMARLVGVRTGRFSILPQALPNGTLRLGYVETARTDPVRDLIIGTAPLLSGGAVTALIGIYPLGLDDLIAAFTAGGMPALIAGVRGLPSLPDFWIWFYLMFVVSSTMLPSASDRQAVLPVAGGLLVLTVLAALAGAGPWMIAHLAPGLNIVLRTLALVFAFGLVVAIVVLPPVWLLRVLISRITRTAVSRT